MDLDTCRRLKNTAEDCRRRIDRAAGAEEKILADLKALGLPDLKAARVEAARLREEVAASEAEVDAATKEFLKKWSGRMGQ